MKAASPVLNGGDEETYPKVTRLVPTQQEDGKELDEAKRKDLVRQAEAIFEIGIYDVVRFDTFWLEK